MHFKWKYDPPTPEESRQALELSEKLNMSQVLTGLLVKRGITTESAAKRFFRPQLSDLINPFLMKDMDVAVDRLNDAMGRKERVLVYGDYDVDGCTAALRRGLWREQEGNRLCLCHWRKAYHNP